MFMACVHSQRKSMNILTDRCVKCLYFLEWREVPELWCARNKNSTLYVNGSIVIQFLQRMNACINQSYSREQVFGIVVHQSVSFAPLSVFDIKYTKINMCNIPPHHYIQNKIHKKSIWFDEVSCNQVLLILCQLWNVKCIFVCCL